MTVDFKLVSDFPKIERRDFALVDPTILKATSTNPLVMGEWLEHSGNYLMDRGAVNPAAVPSFAVFSETGRYEVQAIGKVPVLYLHEYEADTLVFNGAGITLGEALEVADVTYGALTRRGLVQRTTGVIIGYCTRLPANNGGYLRFIKTL